MIDTQAQHLLSVAYFGAFIGSWTFLLVWEGGNPGWALPGRRSRHILRNVALFVLAVAVADGIVGFGLLDLGTRLLLPGRGLLTPLDLPLWGLAAAGLVTADLAAYAFHRLAHRWRWLWVFHAVHHSDHEMDVSTALREHPVEVTCVVCLMTGVMVALGVPLWVEGLRAVFLNPQLLAQHANVDYPRRIERVLGWLFVTPAMHRVHHSPRAERMHSNYGVMFSFWDRIFGSYVAPDPSTAPSFGLERLGDERWQTVSGMLLTPVTARGLATP